MSDEVRLWGGRFGAGPADAFDRLNSSLAVDRRLWPQDVAASRAHARMLGARGIIPAADAAAIGRLAKAGGSPGKDAFRSPVSDFYLTNPIARASAVMAECSALAAGAATATAAE